MSEAPLILGVSGLRGIVGESLTPDVATRYAAAFGTWLQGRDTGSSAVVGRDGRAGGETVYQAAIEGLRSVGITVHEAGVCTTPTIGVIIDERRLEGGIVITASHNPQQWNGLKLIQRGDEALYDSDYDQDKPSACALPLQHANEVIELYRSGYVIDEPSIVSMGRETEQLVNPSGRHVELVLERLGGPIADPATGPRVVVDSVNTSGRVPTPMLIGVLGAQLVGHIGADDSGLFPHTPEPTAENLAGEGGLCDAVPGLKADVGFAQDPDGDRLAIVDEQGTYIGEEYTLALCAQAVLSAAENPPADRVLVTNLSTSRMLEDVAAAHNATVVRTPVGEANVVERMKALKKEGRSVVLGGEGNGGVIWPDVVYVRDSLGSMALVLALMARTGRTVSQLVADINALAPGGKGYAIVKRKVDIPTKAHAQPAVDKVAAWAESQPGTRVDLQDGCRVDLDWAEGGAAWVHVRASNTEPIMRLIAEAGRREDAESLLAAVEAAIAG